MSSPTSIKPRPAGTLKDAQNRLADAVGGQVAAADLGGKSRTVMARYTDPAEPARHMPVDVVRRLERAAGYPHVSAYLAREAGFGLMPFEVRGSDNLPQLLGHAARQHGDVMSVALEALEDLTVTSDEAGAIIREIDEALTSLQAVRARVQAIRQGKAKKTGEAA